LSYKPANWTAIKTTLRPTIRMPHLPANFATYRTTCLSTDLISIRTTVVTADLTSFWTTNVPAITATNDATIVCSLRSTIQSTDKTTNWSTDKSSKYWPHEFSFRKSDFNSISTTKLSAILATIETAYYAAFCTAYW
jgi:hypothetical protein